MLEQIKSKWKEILLVLAVLFGLNQCTESCSRGQKINQMKIEQAKADSVFKVAQTTIDSLVTENKILQNQVGNMGDEMAKKDGLLNDMAKKNTTINVRR